MAGNFKEPFRQRIARFLYGRNGPDTLYRVCVWSALGCMLLHWITRLTVFWVLYLFLLAYAFFRCFSKQVAKRQQENHAFLQLCKRPKAFFSLLGKRLTDREHIYRSCPQCKSRLRLPRVKGTHTARCPRCGSSFSVKIS